MRKLIQASFGAVLAVAGLSVTGCSHPGNHNEAQYYESSAAYGGPSARKEIGTFNGQKPDDNRELGIVGFGGGARYGDAPGGIETGPARPLGTPAAPLQYTMPQIAAPTPPAAPQGQQSDQVVQGQGNLSPGFTGEALKQPGVGVQTHAPAGASQPTTPKQ